MIICNAIATFNDKGFCVFWTLFTFPPNVKLRQTHFSLSVYQPSFPSQVRTNKAEFESLGEEAWWMHEAQWSDGWNDGMMEWWKGRMVQSYPMCCGCFLAKKTIWGFGNRGLIFFWFPKSSVDIFNWVRGDLLACLLGMKINVGLWDAIWWLFALPTNTGQLHSYLLGHLVDSMPCGQACMEDEDLQDYYDGDEAVLAIKLASDDMIYRKTTPSWQSLHPNFLGSPWCLPVLQGKFAWEWASRCLRGTLGGWNVFAEGPTACYMYILLMWVCKVEVSRHQESNCLFYNVATYSSIWTVDVSSHTSAMLFSECAEAEKDHCRFDPSDVDICDQDTLIFCTSSWFVLQKRQETSGELVKISDDLWSSAA